MIEAEWRACTDPQKMLEFLRGKVSDRKLRLFACASCRQIWPLFRGVSRNKEAVIVSERFADSSATRVELKAVRKRSRGCEVATTRLDAFEAAAETAGAAAYTVRLLAIDYPGRDPIIAGCTTHTMAADRLAEEQTIGQCSFLRDLFGPFLFRPITIDPGWLSWNDGTIPKLAQSIYDKRAFDRMPILADALEEAGCDDADILQHCRQPSEHVRGCWVLDLLLGKS